MKSGTDRTQWLTDFLRALSGRAEYHHLAPNPLIPGDPVEALALHLRRSGWLIEEFDRLDTPGHGSRIVFQLRVSRPRA